MKVKVNELTNQQLNWAIAEVEIKENRLTRDKLNFNGPDLLLNNKIFPLVRTDITELGKSLGLPGARWGASIGEWNPSEKWSQAGPIIEREKLMLWYDTRYTKYWWRAKHKNSAVVFYGPTLLIAAMRCYIASKLGNEVEIPEELK